MERDSDTNFVLSPADPIEGWRSGYVRIGDGELGGKASGLVFFKDLLSAEHDANKFPGLEVAVPSFAVLTTEVFDAFLERNGIEEAALAERADAEIAHAFQEVPLPETVRATLATLLEHVRVPLAVRSSSVLEDAIFCPFAGVYETKMIPNQSESSVRLERLEQAIKLVFASTFYRAARCARAAMGQAAAGEKMAVIVQEIVGNHLGQRFYPRLSGVARSHNFYAMAGAKPDEGIVNLALGLGKTIVDGGVSWSYSPARPKAPPPFGSVGELLKNSQIEFWCVNLAAEVADAPTEEAEYLLRADLTVAEADGALDWVASTYDGRSDRLVPGVGGTGPRVLNFAPLLSLRALPLNEVVRELLEICERASGGEVEIEFALRAAKGEGEGEGDRPRLDFLQMRPMVVSHEQVTIEDREWSRDDMLLGSTRVMGNGTEDRIRDLVFVKPDEFAGNHTRAIAAELDALNRELVAGSRPYLLIGFGRWGSSDPWLGIPVVWSQISGARVIVEATLPAMNVELSQGSHFFHNISSCGVSYLMVHHESEPGIDWNWLQRCPVRSETSFLRHVELDVPLEVKIDGRSGRGAVWRSLQDQQPSTLRSEVTRDRLDLTEE